MGLRLTEGLGFGVWGWGFGAGEGGLVSDFQMSGVSACGYGVWEFRGRL